VRITAEGEAILTSAKQMEAASFGLIRARDSSVPALAGEVKLAVTEGLGTFWIAPRLAEFQRVNPTLLVDLSCAMRSADVLRLEADAAVQLTRPTNPDLKLVKLGRLHSMPFAGKSYIDTYGIPTSVEDRHKHRIVLQVSDQTATQEYYDKLFAGIPQVGFVAMRTNVSSAHVWAVAKGAGIGVLPTYVHALAARIVPIDLGINFHFDIWLTYHPDAARIPRVRRMIDWLVHSFDPKRFPWFRDEFIHPRDLPKEYQGAPLANLFDGFIGDSESLGTAAESEQNPRPYQRRSSNGM
jgi:DNA-binding transcriptional LysR family regulator